MIAKLSWNRHFLVFISVLVLALAGLSMFADWLSPKQDEDKKYEPVPDRSVFNAKPSGYQYWYQTIQELNKHRALPVSIRLWRDNFTQLATLNEPSTMVLLEPGYSQVPGITGPGMGASHFSTRELIQLLTWVEQGNTLVYLDDLGRPQAQVLLSKIGLKKTMTKPPEKPKPFTIHKPAPKPLSELEKAMLPIEDQERLKQQEKMQKALGKKGLPNVTIETWEEQPVAYAKTPQAMVLRRHLRRPSFVKPSETWDLALAQLKASPKHPTQVALQTSQTPVLMSIPYGKGEIWLGTMPEIAQNGYLKQTSWDNYQLFTNLVLAAGKPVYINEYVHGKATSDNSLFSYYYQKTPFGRIGIQLFIIFLFVLWWSYSSWRPRQTPVLESDTPVSMQAFVTSLSGLYQKAEAAPLALKPYWQLLARQLEKRCRISIMTDRNLDDIEHLLARHLLGQDGLLHALGYSQSEAQQTLQHLVAVYDVLTQSRHKRSKHYCTEKELTLWVQTMAKLLQLMERGSRPPALRERIQPHG